MFEVEYKNNLMGWQSIKESDFNNVMSRVSDLRSDEETIQIKIKKNDKYLINPENGTTEY